MAAVSQAMFSNAFSGIKMYEFRLKFHRGLLLRFQLTIFQHWFRYWLGAVQATSHYLNQWWLVYWRIYVSLGLNELTCDSTCRKANEAANMTRDLNITEASIRGDYFVDDEGKGTLLELAPYVAWNEICLFVVVLLPSERKYRYRCQ